MLYNILITIYLNEATHKLNLIYDLDGLKSVAIQIQIHRSKREV